MFILRKHIFKRLSGERVFALPDVHGQLDLLNELLEKAKFDENKDKLITLGDMINRGPKSFETLKKLTETKNATHFFGNHELSLIRAFEKHWGYYNSPGIDTGKDEDWQNLVHIEDLRTTLYKYTQIAAYTGTIQLSNGSTFGISHGDAVYEQWVPEELDNLGKSKLKTLVTTRARYKKLNNNQFQGAIKGVDWTLHGHTINDKITVFENSIFLDVGAGSTTRKRKLTLLDLNEFSVSKCAESASITVEE